jgi:hypothetical protein
MEKYLDINSMQIDQSNNERKQIRIKEMEI